MKIERKYMAHYLNAHFANDSEAPPSMYALAKIWRSIPPS